MSCLVKTGFLVAWVILSEPADNGEAIVWHLHLLGEACGVATVIQMEKHLQTPPAPSAANSVVIRVFKGTEDIAPWLELRQRAFAGEMHPVRPWTEHDFAAEFLRKLWWTPERMWLAEERSANHSQLVGTVTLGERRSDDAAKPVVHWLCVDPNHRRQGIARLLMNKLERAAWKQGFRQVYLETHAAWTAALRFYASLGYTLSPPNSESGSL